MVRYRIETLNIEVFSMAFVRETGRNGVLYSGIWPPHRVSNQNKGKAMTSL